MTTADMYRLKAVDLRRLANRDVIAGLRREHERLARIYLRLVGHAERNIRTDAQNAPNRFSARNNRERRAGLQ